MKNVYEEVPTIENEAYLLRFVQKSFSCPMWKEKFRL